MTACAGCFRRCTQCRREEPDDAAVATTLDRLHVGEQALIVCISVPDAMLVDRLADRGLVRGTVVRVQEQALFGGPILIAVRGSLLALRRREAAGIQVERIFDAHEG